MASTSKLMVVVRALGGTAPADVHPLVAPRLVDWSGGELDEKTARAGKRWLAERGFITDSGERAPGSFGRETVLWRVRLQEGA